MPQNAMTVNPVYSNDEQSVVDFQVNGGRQGFAQSNEQDFVEQTDGSFRHIYQDQDTNNDPKMFDWDDYLGDYVNAHPDLTQAIKFAETASGLPDGFGEAFNNALTNEDLDLFNTLAEQLLETYRNAVPEVEEEPQESNTDDQEWFDQLPQEQLEQEIHDLEQKDFTFEDAELMADVGQQFDPGSVERAILSAGIDLAYGKGDLQTMIADITAEFGEATAVAAYFRLMNTNIQ